MSFYKNIKLHFIVFSLLRLDTILAIPKKHTKHQSCKVFKSNKTIKPKIEQIEDINESKENDYLVEILKKPSYSSPADSNYSRYELDYKELSDILSAVMTSLDNKNS